MCLKYTRDVSVQYRCLTGDLPSRMPGKAVTKSNTAHASSEVQEKVKMSTTNFGGQFIC